MSFFVSSGSLFLYLDQITALTASCKLSPLCNLSFPALFGTCPESQSARRPSVTRCSNLGCAILFPLSFRKSSTTGKTDTGQRHAAIRNWKHTEPRREALGRKITDVGRVNARHRENRRPLLVGRHRQGELNAANEAILSLTSV
jgi:hypothetical protein